MARYIADRRPDMSLEQITSEHMRTLQRWNANESYAGEEQEFPFCFQADAIGKQGLAVYNVMKKQPRVALLFDLGLNRRNDVLMSRYLSERIAAAEVGALLSSGATGTVEYNDSNGRHWPRLEPEAGWHQRMHLTHDFSSKELRVDVDRIISRVYLGMASRGLPFVFNDDPVLNARHLHLVDRYNAESSKEIREHVLCEIQNVMDKESEHYVQSIVDHLPDSYGMVVQLIEPAFAIAGRMTQLLDEKKVPYMVVGPKRG